MAQVNRNIIANFSGNIWIALMGLAFVPLYIKFLGIESYGLIGVFAMLLSVVGLLDMGLGATLTREVARLSVLPGRAQEMCDLSRSLEVIYWCIAIIIGIIISAASSFVAHQWVNSENLSSHTIEQAFLIMGMAMALQWPSSLYQGGLMGLQHQVLVNIIHVGMSTLRSVGAVLVLWLISPTIQAFFSWQLIISIINTCLFAFFFWHRLPRAENKASFKTRLIKGVWKFSAGVSGITILATILTQVDKVILSKMLTLEMFGYYTLAGVAAMGLYRLIGPVFSAVYPRFVELISLVDEEELNKLYHKSCQFMAVLILPLASIVAVFSYELMFLWTQDSVTAENSYILLSILVTGVALNGLMNIPYALQLANGWTKLTFNSNLIALFILVPMIVYMTSQYGAIGGASMWVLLNTGYILFNIHFMHKRLLPLEKWRWYWNDTFIPLAVAISIPGLGQVFMIDQLSQIMTVFYLIAVFIITLILTAIATPVVRSWLVDKYLGMKLA